MAFTKSAAVLIALGLGMTGTSLAATAGGARVPVLLELFTSEGCSSCPPADKLLEALDRSQPISGADLIVLSEHVDYWNHGGWSDPFSSAANTARQREYVRRFNLDSGYTPQLVVDGQSELVGSNAVEAKSAIAKALNSPKQTIAVTNAGRESDHLKLHVEVPATENGKGVTIYVAIADNEDHSRVAGGENGGRTLNHVAVVRALAPIGTMKAGQAFSRDVNVPLKSGVGSSGLRVVAFIQDQATGHVLGVTQERIPKL